MSDFDRQNTWLSLQPVTGVKFDDGTTQTSADVEGTVVKSTGEGGGTKFLREDGDGTCSWQDGVSEGTDVKSTGESGGTKFLREDGDGTCSWQAAGEASATGAMWSSGWVNEDSEGETIAAGTAFKFTHNLSTTDVTVTVYAADDSSGTYATKVDFNYDSINTTRGAIVFDVSTNSVMIRTMVSYQAYPGEDSGSTDSGTFRSWASKYIKVIVQAGGVGANQGAVWSSGWVDEDDSAVAVDDGATLTFAHNLGTTDVSAFLIIATDSDGSGSYSPDVLNYGHKDQSYGFHDFTTSAVTVQLGAYRSTRLNTSGAGAEPGSWSGYYIKIVIMSASGGGKVLQIVQSKQGTEDITVDADGTFAESQYEIAITPSSTSSKVLVTFTGQALGVSTCQFCWAIYADDSKILDCGWSDHSTYGNNANLACQFLHSPATSIEVSYKLYFASDNGGTVRCAYGNFGDVPAQYIMGMAKEIAE